MITLVVLKELLREIKESEMTGEPTIEEAIALVERNVGYPPSIYYRVEVAISTCQHGHHSSWMVIFVEVGRSGIQLMRQRVSSCPVGIGLICMEVDHRPVVLSGEEEFTFFKKWGHQIVVKRDVLDLLVAKSRYPSREYVLANSEMGTLMMLSRAIGELVTAVREAIIGLEATKKIFKSEAIAQIRRSLDGALVGLKNATTR